MLLKMFSPLIVIFAVGVGVIAALMPEQPTLTALHDFFAFSVLILGFGALVKFLFKCPKEGSCKDSKTSSCSK